MFGTVLLMKDAFFLLMTVFKYQNTDGFSIRVGNKELIKSIKVFRISISNLFLKFGWVKSVKTFWNNGFMHGKKIMFYILFVSYLLFVLKFHAVIC